MACVKLVAIIALISVPLVAMAQNQDLPSRLPVVSDDLDRESLRRALQQSQSYLRKLPPERVVGEQPRRFTAKEVLDSLAVFDRLLDQWDCRECWIKAVTERFDFIPSSNDPDLQNVLFTGYCDPIIEGSLVPSAEYPYPIYGKPADLVAADRTTLAPAGSREKIIGRIEGESIVPYYSRREIDEQGSLRGKGYEIAWVKDPIELFFLHIEGSGVLRLPDGRQIKVGYAGANGRAYRSIGRLLIDDGKVPREEMSMQRLRQYLTEHPEERSEIMAHNESYVFFRFLEQGPLGSLEVPITAGRSIATDWRLFPKGALAFIFTQMPVLDSAGQLIGWAPFLRFVLNQDTGGAIRGPQRVDLYFGTGDPAAASAGYMNSPGKLYFVLLKKPAKLMK
jgi:membrane-bound lytic murein transglycosylase A